MTNNFLKIFIFIIILIAPEHSLAKIKELTSSYGIKFWHQQDVSAPIISLAIAFKYSGSAYMDSSKKILPSIHASTLLCGCGNYSKEEFQEKLNNIAVSVSKNSNPDSTTFFFKYPKIVSQEASDLIKTMFSSPKFPKDHFEKIKQYTDYYLENYQEIPSVWALNFIIPNLIFNNHPYSDNTGPLESILKLDISDLKAFHKQYLTRSNIEICVFGDISETDAIKLIDNILSVFPKGNKFEDKVTDIEPTFKNITRNHHIDSPQSYIFFVLPNVLQNSKEKYAASILYNILGGNEFKSKIMEKLRSEQGLIYSGQVFKMDLYHTCFEIGILQTSNKNTNDAVQQIRLILKNLREHGISEEELNFTKKRIKGIVLVNLRTASDLCQYYIEKKLHGYSTDALENFLEGINNVSVEQVNALAKKLLDENNFPIIILGGKQ